MPYTIHISNGLMTALILFCIYLGLLEREDKREGSFQSPTGHRINRDGRIIDRKGKIKPLN